MIYILDCKSNAGKENDNNKHPYEITFDDSVYKILFEINANPPQFTSMTAVWGSAWHILAETNAVLYVIFWKDFFIYSDFTEISSKRSHGQCASIDSDNGLIPSRR